MPYNARVMGQVIGKLRTDRGMTQEMLSGLSGIARSHLAMIENGRVCVTVETLRRIGEALGCPLSEIFRRMEETRE